jgi:catechol 2,3-dioxygenase-like lactoylglutathione lyase family enzyme
MNPITSVLSGISSVVYPARDLEHGIATWTAMLGHGPVFQSDDYAGFDGGGTDIGLTKLPWVDHPLVFWKVGDIDAAHQALVAAGATTMVQVADGSLAELGTAEPVDGVDPVTGVVDVPGGLLTVVKAADGSLIGLSQVVPGEW